MAREKKESGYWRVMVAVAVLAVVLIAIIYVAPIVSQPRGQFEAPAAFEFDQADTNQDRVVSTDEFMTAVGWFYNGQYTQEQLDLTTERWQAGGY